MIITAARWLEVLTYCGVRAITAAKWAPIFEEYIQPNKFSLGIREIDDFVGQVLHETAMLEKLVEDLNYSAQRLIEVWPTRFHGLSEAIPYAMNPEWLAEKVYGKRLGNTSPGDGFKYRGRGIPMVTGKANYQLLQELTAEPLVDFPVLLENPRIALQCGLLWWENKVPDDAIDTIWRVTRAVQGGQQELDRRAALTGKALKMLT